MTTIYSGSEPCAIVSRYTGSAALLTAIRAAAALAPEIAPEAEFPKRYGPTPYPFTVPEQLIDGSTLRMGRYGGLDVPRTRETTDPVPVNSAPATFTPDPAEVSRVARVAVGPFQNPADAADDLRERAERLESAPIHAPAGEFGVTVRRLGCQTAATWRAAADELSAAQHLASAARADAIGNARRAEVLREIAAECATAIPADSSPAVHPLPADSSPRAVRTAVLLAQARAKMATDPRPMVGALAIAAEYRKTAAGMRDNLAAGHGGAALLHAWAINAPAADDAAAELERMADAMPAPAEPTRAHPPTDGFSEVFRYWDDLLCNRAEPTEYQAHVLECMQSAVDAGLTYNADTYPSAAALMAERFGYPDARADFGARSADAAVPQDFGTHCYMARDVLRRTEDARANKAAAAGLKLGPLPVLTFNDGKRCTSAVLESFTDTGTECAIRFKRARSTFTATPDASTLIRAINRAAQRTDSLRVERERRKPVRAVPALSAPLPSESASLAAATPVPGDSEPVAPATPALAALLARGDAAVAMAQRVDVLQAEHQSARSAWHAGQPGAISPDAAQDAMAEGVRTEVDAYLAGFSTAPATAPSEPELTHANPRRASLMLRNVLAPLQNASADGVPSVAGLEREAARIDQTAAIMAVTSPQYAADCAEVARNMRELAELERERLAPIAGLDVTELTGPGAMAEFEAAQREPARVAILGQPGERTPYLQIDPRDLRQHFPARFAPAYVMRA